MISTLFALIASGLAASYNGVLSIEALDERADRVVVGEVTHTHTERGAHPIETVAQISVEETLTGKHTEHLEVRLPGGELDGVHMAVPGAPVLEEGQRVVLFLNGVRLVGFAQGAFVLADGALANAPTWSLEGPVNHAPMLSLAELRTQLQ